MDINHVFKQGDPVLIAVFLLLIAMSVWSWYLIFWKAARLSAEKRKLKDFHARMRAASDWPFRFGAEASGIGLSILANELKYTQPTLATQGKESRENLLSMHLTQALDRARIQLDKGLTVLASIGSSAPFIGLFGTVWGIYGALTDIAAAGNASLNVVAGPMGEALVATAIGLFAAIPAVLAYNAFVRMNRLLVQDLRHVAEQLAAYLANSEGAAELPKLKGVR